MSSRIKDMTRGNPWSLIVGFALPLMFGNVFQQLYTVVDTMVVGQALGVSALAAVGAVDWLNWMMLGIIQGLTQGFAIRMAQVFGAHQEEALRKVVGVSAVLSAASAVVFAAAGLLLAKPVLRLLQTPEEIMPMSLLYLRIVFGGIPAVMAYNLFACIIRSLGDGQTPLRAMIVASVVNIILDLMFVLVLRWGIAGAAIATVIAQCCAAVFCLLHLRKLSVLRLKKNHFVMDRELVTRLIALGTPMAFQNAIISVGGMIIQVVVNGFGVIFIAGFTATYKIYGILEIAATSYGYAMITYVGQNLGAGRMDRIRAGQRAAVKLSVITSLVIAVVMIVFGKVILGWFISGSAEEVTQTMEVAYEYLVIMSAFLPVLYILHVCRSSIQGMGNTVLPMASGIAEFIMRTGAVLTLPAVLGQTGVFLAEVLAWTGADVVLVPSYFSTARKRQRELITEKEDSK